VQARLASSLSPGGEEVRGKEAAGGWRFRSWFEADEVRVRVWVRVRVRDRVRLRVRVRVRP